jgi:rhodanese-related sulfurtransferase
LSPLILDLRSKTAFKTQHFPGSLHLPLDGLTPELAGGDLFGDPAAEFFVWNGLQALFAGSRVSGMLKSAERYRLTVLVVCYDGGASQLGTSVLRDRGIEAFNVKGGSEALRRGMVKEANSTDG